jgi:threonine/homoserine/homoserine lactone efflux protein
VHGVKAAARPVVNVSTAGFGAPIVSTIEDFGSVALSLLAVLLPVLVLVGLVLMVWFGVWVVRRRKRKRAEKQQLSTVETRRIFG